MVYNRRVYWVDNYKFTYSNAIKFTPEMGTIEVNTKTEPDYIVISVRDNGTGLSDDEIDKILKKEYFTSMEHTVRKDRGLGLCFVVSLLRKMVECSTSKASKVLEVYFHSV